MEIRTNRYAVCDAGNFIGFGLEITAQFHTVQKTLFFPFKEHDTIRGPVTVIVTIQRKPFRHFSTDVW